jgi:hypothetical protein
MKRLTSLLLLLISLAFSPSVHAWAAVAANPASGSYVYSEAATAENAIEKAMAGCLKTAVSCEILGKPVRATAIVLVKSGPQLFFQASPDPVEAESKAMNSCKQKAKGCRVVQAVWDTGNTWVAIASGSNAGHVSYDGNSRENAVKDAIEHCEKRTDKPGSCSVADSNVMTGRAFVAVATSDSAQYSSIRISRDSMTDAKRIAMQGCAALPSKPVDCKISETMLNKGPSPSPAYMKELLAKVERNRVTDQTTPPAGKVVSTPEVIIQRNSCTTSCNNGNCVSTFPDGKEIRWTAPLKTDPFTMKPIFDTAGCGS